ncbi:class I SAM-dependent methyltransferase [Dyella sp. S184]|uniref:O-methyltransferase n=1 Tax=Dyella sp. S184 TaxID=1641862 RepID=UPI00131E154F|nr:class I SAM-dependent methyltransferase [Dyella sp. S184]
MDHAVESVLAEYDERRKREFELFSTLGWKKVHQRSEEFLMSIGPEAGLFLNILIKEARPRRILELGTSYGHSTIYLAEAARAVGGTVVSCDISAEKQDYARTMLRRAGIDEHVKFELGNAHAIVQTLDAEVDFVLLDLQTHAYIGIFDILFPKLAAGAFVAADNMIMPKSPEADDYRRHIRTKADIDSILLPVGQGIELSRYMRSQT